MLGYASEPAFEPRNARQLIKITAGVAVVNGRQAMRVSQVVYFLDGSAPIGVSMTGVSLQSPEIQMHGYRVENKDTNLCPALQEFGRPFRSDIAMPKDAHILPCCERCQGRDIPRDCNFRI